MTPLSLPNQEHLKECFEYDQFTGALVWKERPPKHFDSIETMNKWNGRFPGKHAGRIHPEGYRRIMVDSQIFRAHRIIWKLVTGNDPAMGIDHRNENKSDNRWENLREASETQNKCNKGAQRDNSTGLKGVYFHKGRRKFTAEICMHGKKERLGYFDLAHDAHQAYTLAANRLHQDFANHH